MVKRKPADTNSAVVPTPVFTQRQVRLDHPYFGLGGQAWLRLPC